MAILLRSQQIPCKLDPHFAAIAFAEDEQWLLMSGVLIQKLPATSDAHGLLHAFLHKSYSWATLGT